MSTSAEIGRRPIAVRRSCSHCGLGPFFTPRMWRPTKSGQALRRIGRQVEAHGERRVVDPGTGSPPRGFSVPMPLAARSRAMPRTPRQSWRLGVIETSITASSRPSTLAKGAPTGASAGRSMMPSCSSERPISRAEHSMPLEAWPRMLPALSSRPVPGTTRPARAKTPFMPVRALGAPHTTCTCSLPVSTMHTRRRSASGCFFASTT
jgi:hypothetical protein